MREAVAAWTQVAERIRARFEVVMQDGGVLGLLGKVGVGPTRAFGVDAVEVVVAIARRGALAPERALALAGELPAGGITLRRGVYLWRVVVPCDGDLVLRAIDEVSATAQGMRDRLRARGQGLELHANYAL